MATQSRLSSPCLDELIAYINSAVQYQDDLHLCEKHKDRTACGNLEVGRRHEQAVRDRVWKYCFKW